MNLIKMKMIAAERTKGRWEMAVFDYDCKHYAATPDVQFESQARKDAEFIQMCANKIDKLLAVVDAAWLKEKSGHNDSCGVFIAGSGEYNYPCCCGYKELLYALEELEK